jgi:lipopolysaccharide/colanic/teichoic acid biosynthesis glycosyltransferase
LTGRTYDRAKRVLDVVGSAAGLLATAPLQLGVALAVALRLGRPVLFRQLRPGRGGELFELVKFRTMTPIDPERGLVTDADRLTPFGRRLRVTSLDELPTLWNVLVGDMSFVGPRPLLPEYLGLYSPDQARRHEVRPGITGLAQVAGRNHVDWADRLALDTDYVSARSLSLDARILWQTLRLVMAREGISAAGEATMAPFRGAAAQ